MPGGSSSKKRSRRRRKRKRKPNPATQLTDDLLVDILSRVPYRSLCRFRAVPSRYLCLRCETARGPEGQGMPLGAWGLGALGLAACSLPCAIDLAYYTPTGLRRLPQTLAGFFHPIPIAALDDGGSSDSESTPVRYYFTNVSGTGRPLIDPSFPFLPRHDRDVDLEDSCNGLLLCVSFTDTEEDEFDDLDSYLRGDCILQIMMIWPVHY
ncbi:unnamed protein product [Miscanthus lutarioriparius]|uniref:F-box domain-containing protein n=1 Tax=Miscanthus lutarioriparius TaxID=422564 RepID=A0A811SL47_9POAL|nr:unnamed protein product [Miscanthus lutarioriparius]